MAYGEFLLAVAAEPEVQRELQHRMPGPARPPYAPEQARGDHRVATGEHARTLHHEKQVVRDQYACAERAYSHPDGVLFLGIILKAWTTAAFF